MLRAADSANENFPAFDCENNCNNCDGYGADACDDRAEIDCGRDRGYGGFIHISYLKNFMI